MKFEQALFYFKRRRNKVQLMEEECAIAALEKQMPKKIKVLESVGNILGMQECYCPNCGQLVAKLYDCEIFVCVKGNYCYNCGQALDWNVEEKKE